MGRGRGTHQNWSERNGTVSQLPVRKRTRGRACGRRREGRRADTGLPHPVPRRALQNKCPSSAAAASPLGGPEMLVPLQGAQDRKGGETTGYALDAAAAARALLAINSLVSSVVECMYGLRAAGFGAQTLHQLTIPWRFVGTKWCCEFLIPQQYLSMWALPEPVREIQMEYADGQAMYAADTKPACVGASSSAAAGAAEGCSIPGPAGPAIAAPAVEGGGVAGVDEEASVVMRSMWPVTCRRTA